MIKCAFRVCICTLKFHVHCDHHIGGLLLTMTLVLYARGVRAFLGSALVVQADPIIVAFNGI